MARPVNANAERTRSSILEAASVLFAARGYRGAGVRDIAQRAGVSLGMIRHYFGSKEGLYRACIGSIYGIYGELAEQISRGLERGDRAEEVIAEAAGHGFRFGLADQPAFKLMLWDLLGEPSWRSELNDREMVPFIVRVSTLLAPSLGRPAAELALALRTIIFLVVRYATADPCEIATLMAGGEPARADERTLAAIEDHLAAVARRLLPK
jgi:AcrR family transcriptional regulator